MLFTSIPFLFFFLLVFFLYWFVFNRSVGVQNLFLLFSSYFFYSWFDWKYSILLISISLANYLIALLIQKMNHPFHRKLMFISGLMINIGTLVIFKYFNFFIGSFAKLIAYAGFNPNHFILNVILPLGISFYIFLSISYIVDVYQRKLKAVTNLTDVLLAFSFFPIILAGPIHRPLGLLPQIQSKRIFKSDFASAGLKQILWGAFMKILIADQCAVYVNSIFSNVSILSGSTLMIGVILFTIQIYADFAGYSHMAIGISRLLGFSIMQNFNYPYFSRDIREFWKRWNISLTTWFRDYVFLPVAYKVSRQIKSERVLGVKTDFIIYFTGLLVTWLLTGLWHGANYTFIIWGLIQGLFLMLYHISIKPRKRFLKRVQVNNENKALIIVEYLVTLAIIMVSWIFFRAGNIHEAWLYCSRVFSGSLFSMPNIELLDGIAGPLAFIGVFFMVEWFGRKNDFPMAELGLRWPKVLRWSVYYLMAIAIFWYSGNHQQFIYFQF